MSTRHSFLSTTGLIRAPSSASTVPAKHAKSGGTKPKKHTLPKQTDLSVRAGVIPLGPKFLIGMAFVFSLVFIASLSCAFVGSEEDEPPFRDFLNSLASSNPGIVLIGDNVDVDVDEPCVTIRWSIIGCGTEYVLAGSEGTHGSTSCGLPSVALEVYVDSGDDAAATYDPTQFPVVSGTGQRLSIQDLYQFDSDHELDVHSARLYPFDTYELTSTLRLKPSDSSDTTLPFSALTTRTLTSSFFIAPSDVASYTNTSDDTTVPGRDITLKVSRPPEARLFAMLLFAASWMLAHVTVCLVVLAWLTDDEQRPLHYLVLTCIILLAVPQLRNTMPDAPGFDGVLLDSIGFFPQMVMSGGSAVALSMMLGYRALKCNYHMVMVPDIEVGSVGVGEEKDQSPPVQRGLERLRRQGASADFRHARSWSKAAFVGGPSVPGNRVSGVWVPR